MERTTLLLLVPDLFFQARLDAAARREGIRTLRATDWRSALEAARRERPAAAVVDLGASEAAGPMRFLEALREEPALAGIRTLGFLSHTRDDLVRAARAAGCGTVVAKSALSAETPARLRRLVAPTLDLAPLREEE